MSIAWSNDMGVAETVIGAWGAVLSTILAVDQFRQRRRGRISISGEWESTRDELQIEIANLSSSSMTIRSVDIGYGETAGSADIVLALTAQAVRLEPGKTSDWIIARADVANARHDAAIRIGRRCFVWVRAQILGVGAKWAAVQIDPVAIGAKGIYFPAEDNIAADLFVGFSRKEVLSQPRPLVVRSKGTNK